MVNFSMYQDTEQKESENHEMIPCGVILLPDGLGAVSLPLILDLDIRTARTLFLLILKLL